MDASDKMKAMGVKPLSRKERETLPAPSAYYEINGVEVSAAEYRKYVKAQSDAASEDRIEMIGEVWAAEMDNRSILFAGEFPRNKSCSVKLKCGCARAKTFTASIYQLSRLERDKVCCTRCYEASKPEQLGAVVTQKGGTLLTAYSSAKEKVRVQCAEGHTFEATPSNLTRKGGGSWCPICVTKSHKGEDRFREIVAERGMEFVDYGTKASSSEKNIKDFDGAPRAVQHSNITVNPPTYNVQRGHRPLRVFYDEDTCYAYALLDAVPPRLPKAIADIIVKNDFELISVSKNTADAYDALREAIRNENAHGDFRILNVYGNDAWESPGVYAWGEIEPFDNTLVSTGEPE